MPPAIASREAHKRRPGKPKTRGCGDALRELDGHHWLEERLEEDEVLSSVGRAVVEAEIDFREERPDVGDRIRELYPHVVEAAVPVIVAGVRLGGCRCRGSGPQRKGTQQEREKCGSSGRKTLLGQRRRGRRERRVGQSPCANDLAALR